MIVLGIDPGTAMTGYGVVLREGVDPDEIALVAIDAGASDVDTDADPIEIATEPTELEIVRRGLEAAGIKIESAELTMLPKSTVEIDAAHVRQNLRLVEKLEDHEDVQRVTANFEISDEIMAEAMA